MRFRTGILIAALLMVQLLPAQPATPVRPLHAETQARTMLPGKPRPSLIPLPKELVWKNGMFRAGTRTAILVTQEGLEPETRLLKDWMHTKGADAAIVRSVPPGRSYIALRLDPSGVFENAEAYTLEVTAKRILLTAPTAHGIFNGIQTLRQLWRSGNQVAQCAIKDAPAFLWRGYMIDVGRNYMPPELLKQQIDVMSRYKLNVFHFHATEDIAWRIAIDRYPQLTAPGNMERDKGKYYSKKELRELVDYCRERHITFVPEIDMPGHSAAFKRALKTDMQSDSGIVYVEQLLSEFCDTYDVPYIHIGADEVKITNPSFIPEITRFLEARGKKVIGWQPGGNFTAGTLRQLWKDDRVPDRQPEQAGYIDSRHLYLNHMDPLEAVVTLFNRSIGAAGGAGAFRGATLCVWHDRAVRAASDVLTMNPVYPGMLAFSERIWRGGGRPGWIANSSDGDEAAFAAFEDRLLDHQKRYFSGMPFPYARQAHLLWQLTGPYQNNGQLAASFAPELETDPPPPPAITASGGTIVLRHWWYPLIKGAIEDPRDSTTWYARTRIWSDTEGKKAFWIGFNNLSRSMATDTPPEGAWDSRGSKLWVNDRLIPPPAWHRAGGKGNLEIPLADEGYEYRPPVSVFLKKGWNKVLVKLPVGSFAARDWQNPVKWMFTFVPVN